MKYNFDEIIDRSNTNSVKYGVGKILNPGLPDDSIPMWIADMDFACPQPVLDAMKARLDRRILGYSMILDPEYYEALAKWMKERHNWDADPQLSLFSNGVVPALEVAVQNLTKPGEGVMIHTPAYHPFDDAVKSNGRTPVYSRLINQDGYYEIDWDDFEEKAKNPATTLFFLCNPHNPTGRVWTKEELRRMGEICFENNVFVVSDEIHFDFIRSGVTHTVFASLFPEEKRMITCTAPSKTFNLAGNQLSNIFFADPSIYQEWFIKRLTGMPNPLSIEACKAAYLYCADWVDELNAYLDENFKHLKERLETELPNAKFTIPQATYLAWIDLGDCHITREELALRLVKEGLQVEYENEFVDNGNGHIRMNLACPRSVLDKAIDRMVKALGPGAEKPIVRPQIGDILPDFTVDTPFEKDTSLRTLIGQKNTMLLFLRYRGCSLCRLDMAMLKKNYEQIRTVNGQVIVFLQSDPEKTRADMGTPDAFPFTIVCDPTGIVYHALGVFPAVNQTELLGPKMMEKMAQAAAEGIEHGEYEGDEMQLPAAFAVTPEGKITYVHYGAEVGDTPDAAEIAEILK